MLTSDPAVLPLLDPFVAVEIQDRTSIALPDSLADRFRGCGGSHGRVAAACKAPFRWALRSGRLAGPILQDGRASDRAVAFRQRARAGTLSIRDRGYWHLDDLAQEDRDGRFWLTRGNPGTAILTAAAPRHELVDLLRTVTADQIDQAGALGASHRLAGRLLARRVPDAVAAARIRRAERTARRKGRSVSATTRARCAWDGIVTNVPGTMRTVAAAWILVGVRGQLEWLFKLWKQHGRRDVSRGVRPNRVLAARSAKLIGVRIQQWILLAGCGPTPDRSLVKAARSVRTWAERVIRALPWVNRREQILTDLVTALRRGGRQTRRPKKPGTWQLLGGVPGP